MDHQLTSGADTKDDVAKYVSATPGLASDEGLAARLLSEIDAFVGSGLMSPRLLPFFWRATALAPSDYTAAKRMLLDACVLLEIGTPDGTPDGTRDGTHDGTSDGTSGGTSGDGASKRLLMPMRMPAQKPAAVAALWPSSTPADGETQLGVRFDLDGARLPPGVIERCVGSACALEGCRPLECWRHGVLLTNAPAVGDQAGAVTALLELTAGELKVEVRANATSDAQVLQQVLQPLVGAVEQVMSEYPGFVCDRKQS